MMEYKPSFMDELNTDYISHHGILGMHWGIRRYQNPDGSLTPAGKKRYANSIAVVNNAKENMKTIRDFSVKEYAKNQNNYDVNKESLKDLFDDEWTEEDFDRKYPNFKTGMNYNKRTAEYYKTQVRLIDAMQKEFDDIDVTKQSFKDTVKLVDDILDRNVVTMEDVKSKYLNSPEYKKWKDALNSSAKPQLQNLYDKYKI